ncbi:penicillin-binding protein 1A [Thiovibrio sp. JS02]
MLTLCIAGTFYLFISLNIPAISSLSNYRPATSSYIYDAARRPVARLFRQNRTVVPLSRMPPLLPQAFVAAEDSRFYQHSGVDAWSVIRALIHNIRFGERGQGGSTITQQVARALLLSPEKTYSRKIKEAILAYRIDKALSKEEILHIYLNQIYLGSGAHGVEAAAQVYFGKHVQELNLAEMALLAGLPQAPSRYSPFRHFKLAKRRQAYVLNRMAEEGYITPTQARKSFAQTLFWGSDQEFPEENSYYLQHVRSYVENTYGSEMLLSGGLRIYTTLDTELQKAAVMAIKRGTAKWVIRQNSATRTATLPQAALVAMEVKTGLVKALVGGTDFGRSQFNRATQARRQPGSAFKPVIYAAALEQGMTPATMIVDEPLQLRGASAGEHWEPKNFDNTFSGPTSFRNALVHSRNIVTIKILQKIGIANAIDLARRLGITSPLLKNLSLALGSSGVSPLELTRAYTAFANGGKLPTPIFIEKIVDGSGRVLEQQRPQFSEAMDARTAYQVTRLLEGVIEEGTGKGVRELGVPAAGKTGTTDQNMDAWFVGYTPEIATCVWVGHDQKIPLGATETGGKAAAPIWLDFMKQATQRYPVTGGFKVPPGIVILPLDNSTGLRGLSMEGADISLEAFKEEQLPWQTPPQAEDIFDNEELGGEFSDGKEATEPLAP